MTRKLISIALLGTMLPIASASAETVTFTGKEYDMQKLIERRIGPGTLYTRLRLEHATSPLNVNIVTVDLTNPYNRIETTVANESAKGTESLVKAASRLNATAHHPLAAANANFWVVATQNEYPLYSGITRNASVRNGKMVTESNQSNEKWDGGTGRTGVVAVSYDKTLHINYCTSSITATAGSDIFTINQCNKGFRVNEICMYNSFFGSSREFIPYVLGGDTGKIYTLETANTSTEVLLSIKPGQEWTGGKPILFEVKEVRKNAGHGTLGSYDLALVGRGATALGHLDKLTPGTEVSLKYNWTFAGGAAPIVEQAIGGNAMVMINGELTAHNTNETYNSQIYSRTGYGCSADGKTLYMVVIDKSTDPVYGKSAGCSTSTMCEIARHFGCANMQNFDAGGSAELMVDNAIVNKTTEASPRNVANGWMIFSVAPDDKPAVIELVFDTPDEVLKVEKSASFTPSLLGYDIYGNLRNKNVTGFTLTCTKGIGTCSGSVFTAANKDVTGTITATCNGVSVTKKIIVGTGTGGSAVADIEQPSITLPARISCGSQFTVTSSAPLTGAAIIGIDGKQQGHTQLLTSGSASSLPHTGNTLTLAAPTAPGVYILRCSTPTAAVTKKILVH